MYFFFEYEIQNKDDEKFDVLFQWTLVVLCHPIL